MAKPNPSKPMMIVPYFMMVDPENPNQAVNLAELTAPGKGAGINPILLLMGFAIAAAIALPAFEARQNQPSAPPPTTIEQLR